MSTEDDPGSRRKVKTNPFIHVETTADGWTVRVLARWRDSPEAAERDDWSIDQMRDWVRGQPWADSGDLHDLSILAETWRKKEG